MRLCGVYVAIVFQYMHAPSTASRACRVEGSSNTRRRQRKHFGEQARESEMPLVEHELVNLSGSDHPHTHLFRRAWRTAVARAKNRHPPTAPLLCQAYSVLLKRRQHLLPLLLAIPLDLSSHFCPCAGRVSVLTMPCESSHPQISRTSLRPRDIM
jgi:hypothetical protein